MGKSVAVQISSGSVSLEEVLLKWKMVQEMQNWQWSLWYTENFLGHVWITESVSVSSIKMK